jgi:pimeloyl-ACP methyl ester carboxylesterase
VIGYPVDLDTLPPADAVDRLLDLGERRWTDFDGGRVLWHIWGDGPPLVLLHGGYGTWAHWIRVIQPLSARFRLLVPDMPGFGESEAPRQPHSAEGIATALAEGIAEILGDAAQLQISGFSFGGVIAGHLAAQLGERVRTLVLVAPGGLGAKRGEMPDLIPRTPDMTAEEIEAAHRRNLEILMFADPSLVNDLALHIQKRNTALHRVKSRPISATDTLAQALRRVPARKAAIWGDRDATAGAYLDQRKAILREIDPAIDFRLMPGIGHWVMYEAPDAFAALLMELLETNPG